MRRVRVSSKDGSSPRRPIYAGPSGVVSRAWDGIVGTFAPTLAHQMRAARMKSAQLLAFESARIDRLMPKKSTGSADAETLPDLQALRDRCRALERDDSHAGAGRRAHEDNVVGKGIVPQSVCTSEATGLSEEECEKWRNDCEQWFLEWAEDKADATGHGSFYDMQRMVAGLLMADGEAIAHAVVDGNQVAVELIDADRLESPTRMDTDRIRGGVEMDRFGRAIAYHVLPHHPFDIWPARRTGEKPNRLLASDGKYSTVQHVFRRDRPGQSRGIPWMASALGYSDHLHHYLNSELVAARSASSYAGVVKSTADTMDPSVTFGSDNDHEYLEDMEPGTWRYLNPGEDIATFQMNRPGTQFEPFVMRVLRAAWAAPGLAYELVSKDFGSMNYSSARTLLLECRRGFDVTRGLIIHKFCRPWWRNVILAGIASGRLKAPRGFLGNQRAFLAARWVPPAYGWVDPKVEIAASRGAIDGNLSTPYDEAARAGLDAEQVVLAKARFLKFCAQAEEKFGLKPGALTSEVGTPAATAAAAPEEPAEPDEDDNADGDAEEEGDAEQGDDDDDAEDNQPAKKEPAAASAGSPARSARTKQHQQKQKRRGKA